MRWSWRDLRSRWVQVTAIALVVALGTGVYVGLSSTSEWRTASYDASYAQLDAHTLVVRTATGTTADRAALVDAIRAAPPADSISDLSARLVVPIQVDASTGGRTILVPGRFVGVDLSGSPGAVDAGPTVDRIDTVAGRPLTGADRGAPVVLLDEHFARYHDLGDTGRLTVTGGQTLDYVGRALQPEYFMIMSEQGTMLAEAGYAVVFGSIETADGLRARTSATGLGATPPASASAPDAPSPATTSSDEGVRANEVGILLRPGTDPALVRAQLTESLAAALPDVAVTVTPITEERVYRVMYDDIEGDQRLYNVFALLILLGAAFAAFNLTGRIVEAQRREIGIGMSLGVSAGRLAVRPMLVGFQVALLGVLLGMAVGVVVGGFMGGIIEAFFPLPVWETPFQFGIYGKGIALGLSLVFVATLYPVARAVRVPPIAAIQTGPRATKSGGLAPLLQKVPLPGSSLVQMPLRNVLRVPRRTLLTALGIAAVIATLVGVLGMLDSFFVTIDRGEAEILRTSPDRLVVDFATFVPEQAAVVTDVNGVPGVARSEPYLRIGGTLSGNGESFDTMLDVIDFANPVWTPSVVDGSLTSDRPALILSEKAAADLGVGPGGTVRFRHPYREGLGYSWVESDVLVAGIHPNPYRFMAFMDERWVDLTNLRGIVNAAQVEPAPGTDPDVLKRALFEQPGIASVQPISAFVDAIRDRIAQFLDILDVVRFAVLALAVLIAFNSSSISNDERAREHATMFAFGVRPRAVLAMGVAESAVVGVLATLLGIGAGLLLLQWLMRVLIPDTLPDIAVDVAVSTSTYVTAVLLGVLAVGLAPLLTQRRLRRMDIPSTLRVVE